MQRFASAISIDFVVITLCLRGGGGGGGGGGHPDFFVKFDLEIAIDQQTRACDRTFERVPDSGCPPVPAGQPRPFLIQIMPNYAKTP